MRYFIFSLILAVSCAVDSEKRPGSSDNRMSEMNKQVVELIVLGNVQDAGAPHAGCKKLCCASLFEKPDPDRMVVSLGIVDHKNNMHYLIEATPDLPRQMDILLRNSSDEQKNIVDGIFITHAHIGHYSGLMYLGRESMNAELTPVYAMSGMAAFIQSNGPWNQLIELGNIAILPLFHDSTLALHQQLKVTPFLVPHRDEYSETVGFKIFGPNKTAIFIPDIDKWTKWEKNIMEEIKSVDLAFIDATFYSNQEIPNRDMTEIPHPFVIESMDMFDSESDEFKNKIYFIHLNHTNPLLEKASEQTQAVLKKGYNIARTGQIFEL